MYDKVYTMDKLLINKMIIPIQKNTNPGYRRKETKGICIHHTACPFVPAINFYSALQNQKEMIYDKYTGKAITYKHWRSFHAALDFDGSIFQFIEWKNRAYASGGYNYTWLGKTKFNGSPSFSASEYTIDIECCCEDRESGFKINDRQSKTLATWCAKMCIEFNLDPETDIHRHMDIAEDKPECPLYLKDDKRWNKLNNEIKRIYNKEMEYIVRRIIK